MIRIVLTYLLAFFSIVPVFADTGDLFSGAVDSAPTASYTTSPSYWTRWLQQSMLVGGGENSANSNTNVSVKENFLKAFQTYIIGLLGIVSVSVFLYIGYILFTAQGKEEEFKKAWKALTYVIVGLAVIPLSFIVVKIVTGFTL